MHVTRDEIDRRFHQEACLFVVLSSAENIAMVTSTSEAVIEAPSPRDMSSNADLLAELKRWFDTEFSICSGVDGTWLHRSDDPLQLDSQILKNIVPRVTAQREAAFLACADHVKWLGLPVDISDYGVCLAVAPFVVRASDGEDAFNHALYPVGHNVDADSWLADQKVWDADALLRLSAAVLGTFQLQSEADRLEQEINQVSRKLASTYEEISILYGVTHNLRLTSTDEQLGKLAIDWLTDCLPAAGIAIQLLPLRPARSPAPESRAVGRLLTSGDFPLDERDLNQLIQDVRQTTHSWPLIAAAQSTGFSNWRFHQIRQLILAPLYEGENVHGWIAAVNHVDDEPFDLMAASLLTSVGAILGIHSGNHQLCRQQSEFMANVVKALTSAIDAKDPYTCGHSDRVARISVRLGRELACEDKIVTVIYLSGLLHDIGKIGIDDNVLRKAGRLTTAEFEHIKRHPELGYKILKDFEQFADVLPVVLHHHEHWDGSGYPLHLAGEDIPYLARICAVADAYDAMCSDRQYRKGMSHHRVQRIFREGSGRQWDPRVIDAFFAVENEIRKITHNARNQGEVDSQQWI